jgi:ankyrin repeat protein
MFNNLMKSWKPNLGKLTPDYENDIINFEEGIETGNKSVVEEIIDKYQKGFDAYGNEINNIDIVNIELDDNSSSPLYLATEYGQYNIAKILIENGADVNWQDSLGTTILMRACALMYKRFGNNKIPKLLLENGANVNIKNHLGQSALIQVCRENTMPNQVIQLLVEHGANVNDIDEMVYRNGKIREQILSSPLIILSKKSEHISVSYLLSKGADINYENIYGDNALICASRDGTINTVKVLINHGAEINVQNGNGDTALMCASRTGNVETVIYLIKNGANIDIQNIHNQTAFDLAHKNKDKIRDVILEQFEKNMYNRIEPNPNFISSLSPEERDARTAIISRARNVSIHKILKDKHINLGHETLEELTKSLLKEGLGKKKRKTRIKKTINRKRKITKRK